MANRTIWGTMLFSVISLFVFSIGTIIGYTFYLEMKNSYIATGILSTEAIGIFTKFGNAILFFDWIVVILMVAILIVGTYWMHNTTQKPVTFLIGFIVAPFVGLIAFIYNYIFMQFISQEVLFVTAQLFPKTIIIATNLQWIAIVMFVTGVVASLIKSQNNIGAKFG
jgi:hypothetical protein